MSADGVLLLKVIVTPALVLAASLAGRHWGQAVAGWLVGLPLTSAPVAFFLALDQGAGFVPDVATGVLTGAASQAAFCVAFGWTIMRMQWPAAMAIGLMVFALVATAIRLAGLAFPSVLVVTCLTMAVCFWLMPRHNLARLQELIYPRWDLPARMLVATLLVVGLTAMAHWTGAWLSGVLATVPVFGGVLAVFAYRHQGPGAALQVVWGFFLGLFAVVGFFFVLGNLIAPLGIAASFLLAVATALAVQGCTLFVMRRAEIQA